MVADQETQRAFLLLLSPFRPVPAFSSEYCPRCAPPVTKSRAGTQSVSLAASPMARVDLKTVQELTGTQDNRRDRPIRPPRPDAQAPGAGNLGASGFDFGTDWPQIGLLEQRRPFAAEKLIAIQLTHSK